MTNQNSEDQLRRAMEEGNLITVGQKSISNEKEKGLVSIDSKFNQTFFKYNLPIGIDFGKSLKPNNFLTSLEILDKTLQIPNLSEKNRFKLENLRLFLTTGKIWHYKHDLKLFLKKEEKKFIIDKSSKKISENPFISLLTSLNFILNQASTANVSWVSQNQILNYVDSEDQKNILREWKTKNYGKLPEDAVFLSLISQTLIREISILNLSADKNRQKENKNELYELLNHAISAKFSEIRKIVDNILNKLNSLNLSSPNLSEDSIPIKNSVQTHPDSNIFIIYHILCTLNILQNE
jgi:hypothetical protein